MKEKISLIVVIIILALIPIGIKYYDSNIKHIEINRDADENEPQDEDYSSGMRIILIGGSNKKENENTKDNKRTAKRTRTKPACTEEETIDPLEEEMKPVDQSNDWLRAVEEALNAAREKE